MQPVGRGPIWKKKAASRTIRGAGPTFTSVRANTTQVRTTYRPLVSMGKRERRMTSRTGSKASNVANCANIFPSGRWQERRRCRGAFTLIELILVMALLAIVLAISAPSLSRFFRSRSLDSEARRFMALTRAAQSRAVSEGVPMVLWLAAKEHAYCLNADKTLVESDTKTESFVMDDSLEVEVRHSADAIAASQASQFKNEK